MTIGTNEDFLSNTSTVVVLNLQTTTLNSSIFFPSCLNRAVFRDENKCHLLSEGIKMYKLDLEAQDEFSQKIEDTSVSDLLHYKLN